MMRKRRPIATRARVGIGSLSRGVPIIRILCLALQEDLENGEDVATCPSCSLIVRVIYDKEQFMCGEEVSAPTTSKELVKC
ncbi:diphthamide biosynthesis protein 3 isoform X2 [Pogona vitticeps]